MRGRWIAVIAVVLAASACSPQCGRMSKLPATPPLAEIPSPTPTPTAPLLGSGATFHDGEVGLAYTPVALTGSGGRAPYTWSVSSGSLPGGLTLGPDGALSGTPTTAGTFTFSIRLADAGDSSASIPGSITIAPALSVGLIGACAQYCNVELGCSAACGGFGQQSGGVAPYAYSLTQGPLPSGTSLSALSLAGTFTGLPGWLQFTVQVSDGLGATASIAPKFWMYDHVALAGGTCGPQQRVSCTVTLPYSGGTPGSQVSVRPTAWTGDNKCGFTAPQPCKQPAFAAVYQPGSVTITLTYQQGSIPTFGTMTVQITSSDLCGSGSPCQATATIRVNG